MVDSGMIPALVNIVMISNSQETKSYLLECMKQMAEDGDTAKYLV